MLMDCHKDLVCMYGKTTANTKEILNKACVMDMASGTLKIINSNIQVTIYLTKSVGTENIFGKKRIISTKVILRMILDMDMESCSKDLNLSIMENGFMGRLKKKLKLPLKRRSRHNRLVQKHPKISNCPISQN